MFVLPPNHGSFPLFYTVFSQLYSFLYVIPPPPQKKKKKWNALLCTILQKYIKY